MKVTSKQEAWNKVNEIFPTDYAKDEHSSNRAGCLRPGPRHLDPG